MYKVTMAHQCACFKKSEFESEKTFERQQDAYNYTNIAAELMNEEFCKTHYFFGERVGEDEFMIRVVENPNGGGGCSTGSGSCGTSCGC